MISRTAIFAASLVLPILSPARAEDSPLPAVRLTRVARDVTFPTEIAFPRDGSGRIFVARQQGLISVVRDGETLPDPFLDIRSKTYFDGEAGLIGLVFSPSFAVTGQFYITYVSRQPRHVVVARFTVPPGSNQADPGSERVILSQPHPRDIHFGGTLRFGPDGFLYIGLGDGGSDMDEENNAQDPMSYFGKILRVDVESGVEPYRVRRPIHSPPFRATCPRSGRSACAIRGSSPSTPRPATSTSATSVKPMSKRSTSNPTALRAERTTAGASWKAAYAHGGRVPRPV